MRASRGILTSWRNSDDPSTGDFVMRIENKGLPEFVVYRGEVKIFRTGKWNGLYLCGIPRFPNVSCKPEFVFKEESLISMSRPYDSMSFHQCRADCMKNCSCTAFANVTDGGIDCLMWVGNLVDSRQLSGAHSLQNIYIRVPVSVLDYNSNLEEVEKKRPIKLILVSIGSGVLVSCFINGGILLWTRRKKQGISYFPILCITAMKRRKEDIELPLIKLATILDATDNFSRDNMIGEGDFGPVYMTQIKGYS